jgi:photosystem II stability/assembly factor-like uncharacterized protein
MLIRRFGIAAGLATLTGLAGCATTVEISPPRIAQGGRALSVAVASNNDRRIVVATETGGLFRTFDGGQSWQHLEGLPNFMTVDVAIASLAPDTIIATTLPQYRAANDGGIWRSTDGGGTWSQPAGWAPPAGLDCPARPGAYGISHMPLSRTFYVGTDCGLAVSNDNGATWSHTVLDPNASGDEFRHRVRSVLVINRTSGVAAADSGLFHLGPDGAWTSGPNVNASGQSPVTHAFASPWWTGISSIFFHASGGQKLWLSTDGGASWTQVAAQSVNNREAFVHAARSLSGDDRQFDVYFGDGANLHRQTFSIPGPTGSGSWTDLQSDHPDPSDIAFDLDRRVPILLATDGGVHRTTDQGANWKLTGGGFGGFVALQIAEITGELFPGPPPHQDLYFGTQDNGLNASGNGGQSWIGVCCEGRFLRVSSGGIDFKPKVTGSNCGPCSSFVSDRLFANGRSWPSAPDGNPANPADTPFLIAGDSYLQDVPNTAASPPSFDFYFTSTAGISWSKSFSLQLAPKGASIFAGPPDNPTLYQGVLLPGSLPNGGLQFGLTRATGLAGQATLTPVDSAGTVAFGSLHTPIARYVVFGVDPKNPAHMLMPDVLNGEMKFSADSGATFHSLPQLTQAVTGGGQYLFELDELSLASVISWDPYDSCHILVGTIQNGIIRSTDGGNTWARIDGSKPVTYVSSFYFPPAGDVWVSTNGRGLWRLKLNRQSGGSAARCRFPGSRVGEIPGGTVVAIDPATGSSEPFRGLNDPSLCRDCSLLLVRNGWVTSLQMSGDALRELAISGGTISQLDRTGREIPLAVPNIYRPGDGKLEGRIPGHALAGSLRVRGLVLEGTRLRFVIAADGELPFAPPRTPMVFAHGARRGASSVSPGEPVRVTGANFLPASRGGEAVRILFDGRAVLESVPVRDDGSFSVEIPVQHLPGEMTVAAEQRDGRRLTVARTVLEITRAERPANPL